MKAVLAGLALSLATLAVPAAAHEIRTLAGSEWAPLEVAGSALPDDVEVFIQFGGDGRVSGSGGCNRFGGTYRQNEHDLSFGPLAATKMACEAPLGDVEAAVFTALDRVAYAEEPEPGRLSLFDADGALLMILSQRDRD